MLKKIMIVLLVILSWTIPVGASVKKLQAPKVSVKTCSYSSVSITWKKVNKARGYEVFRAKSEFGKYKRMAVLSSKKRKWKDKTLAKNQVCFYKVRAFQSMREKNLRGKFSVSKEGCAGVKTPYLSVEPPGVNGLSDRIVWRNFIDTSDCRGLSVYKAASKKGPFKKLSLSYKKYNGTDSKYAAWTADTHLVKGATCYYKACTVRKINGKKYKSNFSKTIGVKCVFHDPLIKTNVGFISGKSFIFSITSDGRNLPVTFYPNAFLAVPKAGSHTNTIKAIRMTGWGQDREHLSDFGTYRSLSPGKTIYMKVEGLGTTYQSSGFFGIQAYYNAPLVYQKETKNGFLIVDTAAKLSEFQRNSIEEYGKAGDR